MLQGLSPEEAEWLTRKAERLGGLDMALRFVLREGLLGFLWIDDRERRRTGCKQAGRAYRNHLSRLAQAAPGRAASASPTDDDGECPA